MINVSFGTNASPIRSTIIDENTSIIDFCSENNIDYSRLTISIDGETIRGGDLEKSFKDFGVGVGSRERCYLLGVIKADNAVGIKVLGSHAILEFDHSIEDIIRTEHYAPELTQIKNADGEMIYKVSAVNGSGSIGKFGAGFGIDSNSMDGKAKIAIELPEGCDIKKYIAWNYGESIDHLQQIEATMNTGLEIGNSVEEHISEIVTIV